ncbi:hypothetical protein RSOL_503290 [Rhizoctonia solani AG-3 Rhs1AP]|uniref:Uncharacterized protein n=1 Tax=Rhizoctonia solani AG-3 Rhs1AP TaxID=1086054 RepID=X8JRW8_9AGAM|nr:hypothetical protein RSOL_503290 [Rhizoctonia solani AG-3 Rhs1AP]
MRTSLGQFIKPASTNLASGTERGVSESTSDPTNPVASRNQEYESIKKLLKNAMQRERRAKSNVQLLREKSNTLCDQFSEACKARESMEQALGCLQSVVDARSTEIARLHEQIGYLKQLTTQLSQELVKVSTELSTQIKKSQALENQQISMHRSRDAMRKRYGRAMLKITEYKEQSSTEVVVPDQYPLKNSIGIIKPEVRDMLRKLACEGVATERASEVIDIVAEGLGIYIEGTISARSVARIMFEGLITARMQIAHELMQAKSITICGDGTSIKHQQFEAKSAYIQLPVQETSKSYQSDDIVPVHRTFGVQRAPTHTAKQQLDGWLQAFDACCEVFSRSPIGQPSRISTKMVAPKLRGMLTDHASDQKRLYELLEEWKRRCDREARAVSKLAEMSVEEQLNMLLRHLDNAVSGVKNWRSLSPEHQSAMMHDAWFALATQIGEEEFQKLNPEVQFDINFLAWTGCCMHKELNVVKGGVANMISAWKELNLTPPIPLLNKFEAQKNKDPDNSTRGVIKLTSLAGALFNNKDDKKGYHSTVDGFFQKEFGHSKRFPDTSNTRFGSHCEAATEIVLHFARIQEAYEVLV